MTFRLASLSFAACAVLPLALSAAQLPGPSRARRNRQRAG